MIKMQLYDKFINPVILAIYSWDIMFMYYTFRQCLIQSFFVQLRSVN
jgi:hypothetical protein